MDSQAHDFAEAFRGQFGGGPWLNLPLHTVTGHGEQPLMLVVLPEAVEALEAAFVGNGIRATVHNDAVRTQAGVPALAVFEFAAGTEQARIERLVVETT